MAKSTHSYRELTKNMQFFGEPEISWNIWLHKACLKDNNITELGAFLRLKLAGGTFVDVPCGYANQSQKPFCNVIDIARQLEVCTYIEVDNNAEVLGTRLQNSVRTVGTMTVHTHMADVLAFISQLEENTSAHTRALYISGLQPKKEFCENSANVSGVVCPYLNALYDELARCSRTGDLVILNDAQTLVSGIDEDAFPTVHPSVALLTRGFTCKRTCPHGKVHIYEKTV